MITVRINTIEKDLRDLRESWIHEQLDRRRRDHESVCVQVVIDKPPLNMVLSTPDCLHAAGRRPPNALEQEIFDLWDKRKLNDPNFTGGNLIAFLKRIS